jgi:uncharacterized protein (TIGR02996 family)
MPPTAVVSGSPVHGAAPAADELLARVLADPDADPPRLVYADWLDDQGDPRGEFIRLQLALAALPADDSRRPELDDRERLLLARHRGLWDRGLTALADGWDYRRGFAEIVRGSARRWLDAADELFARAPVRSAVIYDVEGHLTPLARAPWLARLRSLTVFASRQPGIAAALAAADLSGLVELNLGRNNIDDAGAAELAGRRRLDRLRDLNLADNRLGPAAARHLAGRSSLPHLHTLDLSANPIGPAGAAALIETHHLERLKVLRLARADLGPGGGAGLARLDGLNRLSEIDLGSNDLGDAGAAALARSTRLAGLRAIGLAGNDIGPTGLAALLDAPALDRLERLDLSANRLDDAAVARLCAEPAWPRLTELNLSANPFRGAGVRALIHAPLTRPLTRLRLGHAQVDPWLLRPLQQRYGSALVIE